MEPPTPEPPATRHLLICAAARLVVRGLPFEHPYVQYLTDQADQPQPSATAIAVAEGIISAHAARIPWWKRAAVWRTGRKP